MKAAILRHIYFIDMFYLTIPEVLLIYMSGAKFQCSEGVYRIVMIFVINDLILCVIVMDDDKKKEN